MNNRKLTIIADEDIPFLKGVLEPYADVLYMSGNQIGKVQAEKADALLIRTRTKCNKSLLKDSSVKFIATATIGFDHIDTEYCSLRGIHWENAPGCNSSSVQQYIIAALLEFAFQNNYNLDGKTLGIIGVGNVGSKVEQAAKLLGLNVCLNDPPLARQETGNRFVSLDELLAVSDIISLHVPLSMNGVDKTYHLFNNNILHKAKKGAWIINSSRGEVVKTAALKTALKTGFLGGAILDVWENEPHIDEDLLRMLFIATPHIAGYSLDGKANGTAHVVRALARFFGLPAEDFYPEQLPEPLVPSLTINGSGKSGIQVLHEAVKHTYAIMNDVSLLRESPENFEKHRGNYPLRREFKAYNLNLSHCNSDTIDTLTKLGFRINQL
jgi:erythronate-4-phosphate dehydrogenase